MAVYSYQPEGSLLHTEQNKGYLASPTMLERACEQGRILEETVGDETFLLYYRHFAVL